MTVQELFKLIPNACFDEIGLETKVDNQVKKLTGEVIFKLILFSMLDTDKMSLRAMETLLSSAKFTSQLQPTYNGSGGKYNSIRDRICSIKASYFEKFFETILGIYNKQLQEENALSKVDSTCISLAAKLLTNGMRNSKIDTDKRFLKYTISLTGSLPSSFKIFTEQSYISEDKAMGKLIDERNELKGKTVVFDRGIQSRKNFEKFTADGKDFITRSKLDIKYNSTKTKPITLKPANSTVTIVSDETVYLYTGKHIVTTYQYRVIKAIVY
jgi:hypothetical protein